MAISEAMTISDMCSAFGVTPRTLRFYEQKLLLSPRRDGARRLYSRADRARLVLILRGKRFGFQLEDIRQLLDMHDRGDQNEAQLRRSTDMARDRLAAMERQRADLDATITELKAQLAWAQEVLATFRQHAAE